MSVFSDAVLVNSLIALAGFATLVLLADRYEREPAWPLLKLYALGITATILFGNVKGLVFGALGDPELSPWVLHFGVAGFAEEALKFGVFLWFIRRNREVDEPLDAIIYLGVMALAFAFDENIGYYLNFTRDGALLTSLSGDRSYYEQAAAAITFARALPGHLLIDTVAGWMLAVGLQRGQLSRWIAPAFVLAVLLHGTWNLLAGSLLFFGYGLVLAGLSVLAVRWAWRRSPHRERQVRFRALLDRVRWSDPAIPRKLARSLRTVSSSRQREIMTAVEEAVAERRGEAAPAIGEIMAGERDGGSQVMRVVGLLGGIVFVSFGIELFHALLIVSLR